MAVTTQVDRAFVVAAFARQWPSAPGNQTDATSHRADPALQPLPWHADAPSDVHHWDFASGHELERLCSADPKETGHLAAVQQQRVRWCAVKGNPMRRGFPLDPSAPTTTTALVGWLGTLE